MRWPLCLFLLPLLGVAEAHAQEPAPTQRNDEAKTQPAPAIARNHNKSRVHILEHVPSTSHPTLGPSDAPVTIEFFINLTNALSARIHRNLLDLVARHPTRLRVIYRLTEIREQTSNLAQTFGREAFEQGRFFEFMDAYYGERQRHPSSKDYPEVAAQAGLNFERVQLALEDMRHDEALAGNHFYWRRWLLPTVPGLLINGQEGPRNADLEALEALYDAALFEVQTLQAQGMDRRQIRKHLAQKGIASRPRPRFSGSLDGEPLENPPRNPSAVAMTPLLAGKHQKGALDAKVSIVFACHLQSLLCRTMSREIESILMAYPGEVRMVFHALFDEEQPGQDKARFMHEAALCADEQGAFWEFYEHAFDHQRRINFDQTLALELAGSPALELDVDKFESCLETGRKSAEVDRELQVVRKAGIQHTPALAIGGLLYSATLHFSDIRWLVENELAPGVFETLASP